MRRKRKIPISLLLVITALAVLLVPTYLHHNALPTMAYQYPIPKEPPLKPLALNQLKASNNSEISTPSQNNSAWLLQLGSFDAKINALKLQQQLIGLNYPTTIVTEKVKNKTYYRVQVGPIIGRKKAMLTQNKVDTTTGLHSLLLIYNPLNVA